MKHKKIAFITPVYLPAPLYGSDKYVWYLAEDLAARGYDVSVITSKALTTRYWYDPIFGKSLSREYEVINKVKVYRLNSLFWLTSLLFVLKKICSRFIPSYLYNKVSLSSSGPWLAGLDKLLAEKRFDIIHNSPFPLKFNEQVVEAVGKLTPKPKLIITPFFHEKVRDFANPQIHKLFMSADVLHVISESEKEAVIKRYPLVTKIQVIPLFVKLPKEYSCNNLSNEIKSLRSIYNLSIRKIILFVGIKGEMKGAIDLLMVINDLYKKDKSYLLIALGNETGAWNEAKKQIDPGCLLDLPYTDGKLKHAFYCLCDIFCMPSRSETFGYVYVEAWHKRKPVIAADIPAIRELVGINRGGKLVRFGDRSALGKAITDIMGNKSVAGAYGTWGYQAFMRKYRYMHVIRKYLALFDLS